MQSTPSLTAFVAGATGYTGREVVRVLADRGARVVAHVRPDSTSLESRRRRFTEIGAEVDETPWDEAAMTATLERLAPGVIFGLLGTTRARAARAARAGGDPAAESYERVDYGLTMQLVRSAVAARAPARFVYLSSLGVPDRPSGNAYLDVRRRVEAAIRASGLRFTLARPSFITGEDRDEARTAERVASVVTDAALSIASLLGGRALRDRYASTDARTLAAGLVRVAIDPAFEDRVAEGAALRGAP